MDVDDAGPGDDAEVAEGVLLRGPLGRDDDPVGVLRHDQPDAEQLHQVVGTRALAVELSAGPN
jgi:hypothetical protein